MAQVDAGSWVMLDTANGEVTRLTDELAAAPTQAQVDAIQGMLDTANGEVTRLTDELAAAQTSGAGGCHPGYVGHR